MSQVLIPHSSWHPTETHLTTVRPRHDNTWIKQEDEAERIICT